MGVRKLVCVGLALVGCSGEAKVLVARPNRTLLLAASEERPQSLEEWQRWQTGVLAGSMDAFDGAVVDLGFGRQMLERDLIDPSAYAATAEIARSTSAHLAHNLQLLSLAADPLPWADDAYFAEVAANFETAARLARDAGMKGVFIDNQSYGPAAFSLPAEGGARFAAWEALAQQRGAEVTAAILRGYPGATLMLTWAYAEMFRELCIMGGDPIAHPYALYPAFVDGMRQAAAQAGPLPTLIDGYLPAYPARDPTHFALFAALVKQNEAKVKRLWRSNIVTHWDDLRRSPGPVPWPARYARVCSDTVAQRLQHPLPAALGLMVDYDPNDFARKAPAAEDAAAMPFAPALTAALRASDTYVWLYSGSAEWIDSSPSRPEVNAELLSAIAAARQALVEDPLGL